MTLHAQHLAYLPAARRHQRRMRALKDYQKLIDEMQGLEADWSQTPVARRNRELISMWQEQVCFWFFNPFFFYYYLIDWFVCLCKEMLY